MELKGMYTDYCDSKGQVLAPLCGPCSASFAKNAMKRKCRSSLVREIIVLMAGSPSFHPLEGPSLASYHQAVAHQKQEVAAKMLGNGLMNDARFSQTDGARPQSQNGANQP